MFERESKLEKEKGRALLSKLTDVCCVLFINSVWAPSDQNWIKDKSGTSRQGKLWEYSAAGISICRSRFDDSSLKLVGSNRLTGYVEQCLYWEAVSFSFRQIHRIIFVNSKLAQFLFHTRLFLFLTFFGAAICPSSGELIVSIRHLVYVTLYKWQSGVQVWMSLIQTCTSTRILDVVLIQLILLMMGTWLPEACR